MPISLSCGPGVIACGCRYITPPLKRLLTYTLLHNQYQQHRQSHRASQFSTLYSLYLPPNLNRLLTGNCPFFRMEGNICYVGWLCYVLLATFCGACCAYFTYDAQSFSSSGTFERKIQSLVTPNVDAMCREISSPMISSATSLTERYWTGSSINKNKAMVENLQRYGVIASNKVAEVMDTVDRALFVPDGNPPYVDSPMPIGYNATISAPHMHATCLQLLEENLQPGMHALDVGSGTGYLTACFALMVGPQGRAVGVEHIPELVTESIKNIEKSAAAPLLKEGSLSIHVGDGRQGWPEFAPYDAIHVGAAAPEIPKPLIDQLKRGGRMVIPVGNIFQDLKVVDKDQDGSITVRTETSVRYVPLTSREAQLQG